MAEGWCRRRHGDVDRAEGVECEGVSLWLCTWDDRRSERRDAWKTGKRGGTVCLRRQGGQGDRRTGHDDIAMRET